MERHIETDAHTVLLGAEKRVEDATYMLCGDADATIGHGYSDRIDIETASINANLTSPAGCVLNRMQAIKQQIQQHLLDLNRVSEYRSKPRLHIHEQVHVAFCAFAVNQWKHFSNDLR